MLDSSGVEFFSVLAALLVDAGGWRHWGSYFDLVEVGRAWRWTDPDYVGGQREYEHAVRFASLGACSQVLQGVDGLRDEGLGISSPHAGCHARVGRWVSSLRAFRFSFFGCMGGNSLKKSDTLLRWTDFID